MKRKSKAMGFLITGEALAAGIAISSGIIRNSYVADEAKAASAYSHTITAKTWDSYGAQTLSGVSWTAAATGGAYWGYDGTKGQQFGSGNSPAKPLTLSTSDINGSISSISISTSGASSVSATIGVSVGGSQYGDSPKNITASNATYTFSGNATGEIIFTWTQTSSKALYLKAIEIEYSSKTLSSLSVSGTPTKTSYYAGESFNPAGLTITANYNDESSADVTSECTFSPNPLTAGVTSVTASYTEGGVTKTADITGITVSTRTIETLEVTNNPAKMVYIVGESFDPTGMIVKATFDSGDPVNNYIGYVYSPSGVLNSVGAQVITISDAVETEVFTSLNVQVNEAPLITELFISEYIEGSSNNKAIEIYNGTGASVDLSIYSLKKQSNGAGGWGNDTVLSGTLTDKDVYIMAHSSATAGILALADSNNQGVMAFNGNDAIGLFKNDTLIDIVGVFNSTSNWGLDTTLVRKSSITSPSATYSSSNWDSYLVDTFTNLGSHTVITSTPQHELDAIAWGTDFLSATAAGCSALDQSQLLTAWSGLETSFNALSSEAKNYLTSLTPNVSGNDAQHAVARYIYIITKYGDATFADFMNLDIQAAPSVFDLFDDGYNYVPIIAIIYVVGLKVLISY